VAFYRGLLPNVIGVIPYAGIDFAIYESLKKFCTDAMVKQSTEPQDNPQVPVFMPFLCGTFSSVIAQFFSYPLTLVRTRLQAHGMKDSELYL
jgi:solute carrier family 25 (mitochondrial phosphate transporter), member 23/24/25/41